MNKSSPVLISIDVDLNPVEGRVATLLNHVGAAFFWTLASNLGCESQLEAFQVHDDLFVLNNGTGTVLDEILPPGNPMGTKGLWIESKKGLPAPLHRLATEYVKRKFPPSVVFSTLPTDTAAYATQVSGGQSVTAAAPALSLAAAVLFVNYGSHAQLIWPEAWQKPLFDSSLAEDCRPADLSL